MEQIQTQTNQLPGQPSQSNLSLNDGTQLDAGVVKVMKALKKTETGSSTDPWNQVGDNGSSFGAYQWNNNKIPLGTGELPSKWKEHAKQFLGDENAPMTPENQNKAVYGVVKSYKDKGLEPEEIAALWNGARKDPNTGKYIYNNPQYGEKFRSHLMGDKTVGTNKQTQTVEKEPKEGILSSIFRGITAPVATMLARPIQLGARLLGSSNEAINKVSSEIPFYGKDGALDVPETGKDILKDVGRAAQTVSLGLPVGTIPKAIGMGALAGAGAGLEKDGTLSGTVEGAATGAALGGVGGLASKALEWLPKSLAGSAFKNANPAEIEYALKTKSVGTKMSLLNQNETAINRLGKELGTILDGKNYRNLVIKGSDILEVAAKNDRTKQALLDTGLGINQISKKISSTVPEVGGLVEKLFKKGLSLPELHRLNSKLGNKVFRQFGDEPGVRAGKELGSIIYHGTSEMIKTLVPKTGRIFDELTKEYGLSTALNKMIKKSNGLISWRDLIPFFLGQGLGPLGGVGAAATARAIENPAVQFGIAKGIQKVGGKISPISNRTGLLSTLLSQKVGDK